MIQHQSFSIQHEISVTLVNLAKPLTILKKSSFQQIHVLSTTSSFASVSAYLDVIVPDQKFGRLVHILRQ